jgi:hypothetical protein
LFIALLPAKPDYIALTGIPIAGFGTDQDYLQGGSSAVQPSDRKTGAIAAAIFPPQALDR